MPVGLYVGPSLKFRFPVSTNFSFFHVSFSAFVIFNHKYEHLMWIKFRVYLIPWSA